MAANDQQRGTLLTVIYYMFLGGVYHERYDESKGSEKRWEFYVAYIYGYLIILAMCILERVCIQWLRNRFGCDE